VQAKTGIDPSVAPSGDGCVECLAGDGWWFHLRRCALCGHIGCCDNSPSQHATRHFAATGHPYIQSYEPGEDWFWDYSTETISEGPALAAPQSHPRSQPVPGPAGRVPGTGGATSTPDKHLEPEKTMFDYETLRTELADGVLDVAFDAPPMNLIGPELVRDLVGLLGDVADRPDVRVVVFGSADPDYFLPHVDLTKVPEYTAEAGKAGGPEDASLGMLWHRLSQSGPVTIAKIRGRAGGAGSEFALACDLQFASERAVFGQPEVGMGAPPGAGALQHLTRLLGRNRALEVVLTSSDYSAELAERYGWINRAVPDAELDDFVGSVARRIASFPAEAVRSAKSAINELSLAPPEDIRADARRFQQFVQSDALKARVGELFSRGLQRRGPVEDELGAQLESLPQVQAGG
jgi:enoyl-CoA hydratase/carnithine racemase